MHHLTPGWFSVFVSPSHCPERLSWLDTVSLNLLLCMGQWDFFFLTHSLFNSSDLLCRQLHANCGTLAYSWKAPWPTICVWTNKLASCYRAYSHLQWLPSLSCACLDFMISFYDFNTLPPLRLQWLCVCFFAVCMFVFTPSTVISLFLFELAVVKY